MAPKWGLHSFGKVSEFLRNRFLPKWRCFSKLASAKLQRKKGDSKFFANLWRFEMLKSAHFPSVYGERFIFFVARKCADFKKSFDAKMTLLAKLTFEARNRPICTLLVTVKKWHFGAEWQKKWHFCVRKLLRIIALKVVIGKMSFVICHFSQNWKQKNKC